MNFTLPSSLELFLMVLGVFWIVLIVALRMEGMQ